MSDSTHAPLAPSDAKRWMNCPGALRMTKGVPDTSSDAAEEGTAAHWVASECLTSERDPGNFVGLVAPNGWKIKLEYVEPIRRYVETIRAIAHGGELLVEQRVHALGVHGECYGTGDALVIPASTPRELGVHDLKFGMGVRVHAEENPQLMLYGLGGLNLLELAHDFDTVRLAIHQPRLEHVSEHVVTIEELATFAHDAQKKAREAFGYLVGDENPTPADLDALGALRPSTDACMWCRAKAICPAYARLVAETTRCGFDPPQSPLPVPVDLLDLSVAMARVDMVEDWARAVRAEVERRLFAGETVAGWKLVMGKRGNRAWQDEDAVEAVVKSARLKFEDAYTAKLKSPTALEKTLKKAKPRVWARFADLITQADGQPSVAPESDERAAWTRPADAFTPPASTDEAPTNGE